MIGLTGLRRTAHHLREHWRRRAKLAGPRPGSDAADSSPAPAPQVILCPHCLYEPGGVPAMKAVRRSVRPDPNSFSCERCGRSIDPCPPVEEPI